MSFKPHTYEEAREKFKPMKSQGFTRKENTGLAGSPARAGSKDTAQGLKRSRIKRQTAKKGAKKKGKKLTDGQLKKKVWKEFSIFIRTRGADSDGMNVCVTCGRRLHWKELQAGHFLRGRLNANLFEERGTYPQCYGCNVGKDGEVVVYYRWMVKVHGEAVIDELIAQNNVTHKWQGGELQGLLDHYRALNAANPLLKEQA